MKTGLSRIFFVVVLTAYLIPLAGATPWQVMGPRAMGMGGAQVAIAQGPEASYWNPAGLAQAENTSGLAIPIGARGEFTGTVLQGAKDLNKLISDCKSGLSDCTQANVNSALANLGQSGNGVLADVGGGLQLKIKHVAVFFNELINFGAVPKTDLANTSVAGCPGAPCALNNNQSVLVLRGASFSEFGVGYGYDIGGKGLILGGNLKGIIGKVGYSRLSIATEDPGNGGFSKFTRAAKTSFQPGVDLGLLWDMRETFPVLPMRPRFGLVGRDINNPKFSQPDAALAAGERSKYSLQGQSRAGFAISPFHFWNIAADLDLTNNVTNVDGFKSRYGSLGTEINVFNRTWINIPLRVGLQKNLSDSASGLSYTGGFGLNFLHVVVDLGAMVSSKTTTIQTQGKSDKLPNNIAGSAQIALLFGGGEEPSKSQ